MSKKLIILIAVGALLFGSVLFMRTNTIGTTALWSISNEGTWLLPLVAVAALIDSINPCAFSVLVLTIAFLFSIGKLRSRILRIGSSYIAGIFIAYMAIGLGILQTLHLFDTPHFMAKVGALLLIVLGGINLVNEFFPSFPIKLRIPHAAHRKIAELAGNTSLPAAFLLGGLVGLCEFPCTGGPYLMVLGLLHDQATYLKGVGFLLFYNIIFVAPLAVILLISSDEAVLGRVESWQKKERGLMRVGGGIAMVALGILIFLF